MEMDAITLRMHYRRDGNVTLIHQILYLNQEMSFRGIQVGVVVLDTLQLYFQQQLIL